MAVTELPANEWPEAVSPVVIKELRQGLRARSFVVFFTVLLVVCVALALWAGVEARLAGSSVVGPQFLASYLTALSVLLFFVLPFTAFRSMSRELEDETWVLLTLTGLGSLSIVRGKWLSALAQAALYASAAAPFVLFTYFLNGVELLQLAVLLGIAAIWSSMLTAFAIALATQGRTRLGRSLSLLICVGCLGLATFFGIMGGWGLSERFDRFRTDVFGLGLLGSIALVSVLLTVLLLEAAATSLASWTENQVGRTRLAFAVGVVVSLVWGLGLHAVQPAAHTSEAAVGQILICMFLTLSGAFCISERDGWHASNTSAWIFRPGALRSFLLVLFLIALSTSSWLALLFFRLDSIGNRHFDAMLAAPLYPVLYLSLGVLLGRLTPLQRLGEPVASRVGFATAVVVGSLLAAIGSLVISNDVDDGPIGTLGPIVGMFYFIDHSWDIHESALGMLVIVTVAALVPALVVLGHRDGARA